MCTAPVGWHNSYTLPSLIISTQDLSAIRVLNSVCILHVYNTDLLVVSAIRLVSVGLFKLLTELDDKAQSDPVLSTLSSILLLVEFRTLVIRSFRCSMYTRVFGKILFLIVRTIFSHFVLLWISYDL